MVRFEFLTNKENSVGYKGAGDRHGKSVCAQCGESAVCQQDRLKEQHDDAQDGNCAGAEKDGAKTGSCHMGTASRHGRNL